MSEETPDILTLVSGAQPDKLAVVDDRPQDDVLVQWTFADLEGEANRLAHVLADQGVGPGSKVLWCGLNSPGIVRIVHAARKLGATAVPLNYRLAAEEAGYVADNSDAEIAYIDADFVPLFAELRSFAPRLTRVLVFDGEPGDGMISADAALEAAPSDTWVRRDAGSLDGEQAATMIYTSGTTGKPKGAVRKGLGDPNQLRALISEFGYRPEDVYLTTGPIYHSGPGGFMGMAQAMGQTVVVQRKFDAEDWLRLIERWKVTSTFSAPTPIRMVTQLPDQVKAGYDRSSMRVFVANAAPWSWALKEAYLRDFPEDSLFEVYGSTELGVNTILRPEDQRRKQGSCGRAAPGVELALFDDDGNAVTVPGQRGELFARSRSVFHEYHKARDKYEEDRRGDFHTVGDVAWIDDEGFVFICDRKKDMIISGGVNVYPAEIEAVLDRHPDVLDVAVFGIPSEQWGESVHAVLVRRNDSDLEEGGLIDWAREQLAGYKIPRSVSFMDAIPRNGSGKILKRELRAPYWEGHERSVG
jgi:acyl-CoA synthetase (AMP-forming)/AMP-acid ligase II